MNHSLLLTPVNIAILVGMAAFVFVLLGLAGRRRRIFSGGLNPNSLERSRTYRAKSVLSNWEARAYRDFSANLKAGHHLCPQVRLADFIDAGNANPGAHGKLRQKSVDFLVIDNAGTVLLVIELNDKTHDRPDRRERDAFLRDVLRQAGIPLAVFKPHEPLVLPRYAY